MWVFFAFLCGWLLATSDMLCKRALEDADPFSVAWARLAFAAPFLIFLANSGQPPKDLPAFLLIVAALVPLEVLALYLYMSALKKSPLSLTVPFLAFTPGFILITGRVILGEHIGPAGIFGVGLVIAGAYVLSARSGATGVFAPFKNFIREPGCVMMAGVALIYSITATGGKKLILMSSPIFVACFYPLAILTAMTIVVSIRPNTISRLAPFLKKRIMWAIGLAQAGMIITHSIAISMAPAAYMISVKRTSLFFGVIYGLWIFGEKDARFRILGSIIMLAGVFMLGFFCADYS